MGATGHQNWRLAQLNNVLFSDEVRMYLQQVDGRHRVWQIRVEHHNENCVQPKISYGGSITFSRGISHTGKTTLVRMNGNLNAQRYVDDINIPHIHPFTQHVDANFALQQDNTRAHTA